MAQQDTASAASAGRRPEGLITLGLIAITGIWLVVSPFVLGYGADDLEWNPIVAGGVVVVLGVLQLVRAADATLLAGVTAAVAVWLFVSSFWLAESSQAIWNTWITGVALFVFAVFSAAVMQDGER